MIVIRFLNEHQSVNLLL